MSSSTKTNMFIYTPPTPFQRFTRAPLLSIAAWLYTHQPPISCPTRRPTHQGIKIVCISDTHTLRPNVPNGDVLIHAGDMSINGTFSELRASAAWLASLPHTHKLAIAGNHDLLLDTACHARHAGLFSQPSDHGKSARDIDWGSAVYMQSSSVALALANGKRTLRFYADPRTPRYGNWAFQYGAREGESGSVWRDTVPCNTDVLITHGPSAGHLDRDGAGCAALFEEVWRARPRLHVHGHIHAGRGVEVLDWGAVQWCYDAMSMGKRGVVIRLWIVGFAFVAWCCVWLRYWVLGMSRRGESVLVNAAWEGNEGKGITVVTM